MGIELALNQNLFLLLIKTLPNINWLLQEISFKQHEKSCFLASSFKISDPIALRRKYFIVQGFTLKPQKVSLHIPILNCHEIV